MEKQDKRRKFHDTLLNIFYPPPQQPPYQQEVEEEEPSAILREEGSDVGLIDDVADDSEEGNTPCDMSECTPQKFTRAQRKRLRRKKLKEAASHRRKIIGPLLPSMDGEDVLEDNEPTTLHEESVSENVSNAIHELDDGIDNPGEPQACATQKKLKHRRMAKRLSRSTMDRSRVDTCLQINPPCGEDECVP